MLPAGLERLVMACLAKDPGERPHSAEQLAERLRQSGMEVWSQANARDWWAQYLPDQEEPAAEETIALRREAEAGHAR